MKVADQLPRVFQANADRFYQRVVLGTLRELPTPLINHIPLGMVKSFRFSIILDQPSRNRRSATLPPDGPADAVTTHDAGHLLVDMAVQYGPPRDERELPALFDERIATGSQLDRATIDTVYPLARPCFGIGLAKLVGELPCDPAEFTAAERR